MAKRYYNGNHSSTENRQIISLQSQKSQSINIKAKISKYFIDWTLLGLPSLGLLILLVISLSMSPQVHTKPSHVTFRNVSNEKNAVHQLPPPDNTAQPSVIAPTPTPAVVSASIPKQVKTLVQTDTAKPEPVITPSPSSSVSGLSPITSSPTPTPTNYPTPTPSSSSTPSSQTATGYTSTNWSGYLATSGSFTGISGSWNATLATGKSYTTSADSTWIGIGGVTSGDLIQVGTENIISASGQVSASAFYELLPAVSQPVPGVTITPGDSISASIFQVSNGEWAISITDKTDGESNTINVSYTSSLSSAEWIEEDPSYSSRHQIPFDNFQEASFSGGSSVDNGNTFDIAQSTAQPVTMVNQSGETVAEPSVVGEDGSSFTISP